ncbi:Sugar or nucleoside kinase, ribokinase family [Halopelagius inordinatus]|uniref:Sugar or nucleoside kinase, ribokinase family n=1 Tax=Halopelagius inordinatus TaxID=553467 RepID=A0A1I2NY00_9EURY|nr:PfkB family carbohydrate kinase [Halopelagius inordinatus]SFG08598.1 Sugar or nucleoside kinase, ribokinase family [Halopelagius inordinatus]
MRRPYESVAANLADLDPVSVCCLPDGSVDDHYELGPDGGRVASRRAFARAVANGRGSLPRRRVAREPGGQAVNAARQAAALGDEVTLFGHLDHDAFERLDPSIETLSFGAPSAVDVLRFEESDLMLVAESSELESWSGSALREDRPLAALRDADAVCVGNWASVPGLEAAFDALAEEVTETLVVVDPGPVSDLSGERVEGLLSALRSLSSANEVVLSLNGRELSALVDHLDEEADDDTAGLAAVSRAAALRLAVLHDPSRAVAVSGGDETNGESAETVTAVPNAEADRVVTTTGAGDRFSAGLGRALAAGWPTAEALALGNLCATYRVATGGTGTAAELRAFAEAAVR